MFILLTLSCIMNYIFCTIITAFAFIAYFVESICEVIKNAVKKVISFQR